MKNKKIILPLLTALLFTSCDFNGGTTTSSNDSQLSDSFGEVVSASSSEEVNSNFPFDEIKTFFNTDIVPPSFEGEEISIEKSEVNNAQYVTVYTVKNDKASNDYFNTYLKTLGYNDPIYVNNEVEGEYYYVDSTSTLPYQVVYYEETIDDVTYFIVQYSFGDSYSDDYTITTSFPDAEIKAYLGLTESIVSFVSSEYYYAETEDDGYLCFFMYITDGSMNADSYYTLLSNASYIIEQYTTTDGLEYYDAYNQDTGYEVLFYDLSDDNSFNLQIYSLYEDSIGGDEEIEYTEYTSFPGSNIKTFLNGTNELPSYESDKYYYYEDNLLGLLKYVFVYSTISTTACNDAYKIILENASYVVEYDEEEEAYYAYNETSGYSLYFYEEEGNFCLTIYEYFDYSDDGDDYGDYDEYTSTTTFPDAEIKTYLGTTNSVISFEASEYYYAETEDYYGYTCFFLYILDGSMNADSYYKLLNNASYTIEPIYYEDSTELSHYDAYNEEAGYEILFWDESEDDSFNIQIYALDDSTIDDGNDDNTQDEIKLVDTLFASSYGENSLTVNGITFEYNYVMKSTNYAGTFQWKKNAGTMHNTTPLSGTTSLVVDLNYCYGTPSITVYGGNSVDSCNSEITPTVEGTIYTFDITSYAYISISNTGSNAFYLNSITIK